MCQKKEEVESPALKILRLEDYIKRTKKGKLQRPEHKQHKDQHNNNNQKTKLGRKTRAWIF